MEITGAPLGVQPTDCPYLSGRTFESETVFVRTYDQEGLEYLLSIGFRHFSRYFFRPVCRNCHQCIPLRVSVADFTLSRNLRRVLHRAGALKVQLEEPKPESGMYELYRLHAERFEMGGNEDYEGFRESFFTPLPGNRMLTIRDGNKLVAVSHLDITSSSLSAIYCYWDPEYSAFSPGKLAIIKEIQIARSAGLRYLYLGYYVPENDHMNYKIRYKPNEVLLAEGAWVPFFDAHGRQHTPGVVERGFRPSLRLSGESEAGARS